MTRSLGNVWRDASQRLHSAGLTTPRLEAEILLRHVTGQPTTWLFAHPEAKLSDGQARCFDHLLERRLTGQPIAYLTGRREFWSMALETSPVALIPRPETELLVELALRLAPRSSRDVVDLGTGSGAIAVALASERPDWRMLATDESPGALALARRNAARFAQGRVELRVGNWWQAIPTQRRFDLIVSNPPYVAEQDPHLAQGDLRFEPDGALASGPDGLDDIREILAGIPVHLAKDGWLLVEHGAEQGAAVRDLFKQAKLAEIRTEKDLAGLERATRGKKP